MREYILKTSDLSVGYNGNTLIHDINISVKKGQVLTLIGPNGSGKSNIADALQWVMGEQSTKALRGGKMEDVIMIQIIEDKAFLLHTPYTSYIFRILETGQLEHLYYGRRLHFPTKKENAVERETKGMSDLSENVDISIVEALTEKHAFAPGNVNVYDQQHKAYSLEDMRLEMSAYGKGDIREPFIEVVHVDGSVDPIRDIETINLELIFADLEVLQRRQARVGKGARNDKTLAREHDLLSKLIAHLEEGNTARSYEPEGEEEASLIKGYWLLTAKPVIYAANVAEDDLADDGASNEMVQKVRAFAAEEGSEVFVISAQIEQEIAELDLPGYAIGGLAVGETTRAMYDIIETVEAYAPQDKPRYLMGVGTPGNIIEGVSRGIDFFDCVMPARNGRHGHLFTWNGIINIRNEKIFFVASEILKHKMKSCTVQSPCFSVKKISWSFQTKVHNKSHCCNCLSSTNFINISSTCNICCSQYFIADISILIRRCTAYNLFNSCNFCWNNCH